MNKFYLLNVEGNLVTAGCRWTRRWADARAFDERAFAQQLAKALDLRCVMRASSGTEHDPNAITIYGIETLPASPALRVRERDGLYQLVLTPYWLTGEQMGDCLEGLRTLLDLLNG